MSVIENSSLAKMPKCSSNIPKILVDMFETRNIGRFQILKIEESWVNTATHTRYQSELFFCHKIQDYEKTFFTRKEYYITICLHPDAASQRKFE